MQGNETKDEWKEILIGMIIEDKTFAQAYHQTFQVPPDNAAYQRMNLWRRKYGIPVISQIQGDRKYIPEIQAIGTKEISELRRERYEKENELMKRWNTFPDLKKEEDEEDMLLL